MDDEIIIPGEGTNCFLIKTYFGQPEVCESDFCGAYIKIDKSFMEIVKKLADCIKQTDYVYEIVNWEGDCTFIPESFEMQSILCDVPHGKHLEVRPIENPDLEFDGEHVCVYEQYLHIEEDCFHWRMIQKYNGLTYETIKLSTKDFLERMF